MLLHLTKTYIFLAQTPNQIYLKYTKPLTDKNMKIKADCCSIPGKDTKDTWGVRVCEILFKASTYVNFWDKSGEGRNIKKWSRRVIEEKNYAESIQ